jgi:TPR repeat protein
MCNLGVLCEKGEGVPKDARAAVSLYRKAAELGDADAMFHVGMMCANGVGVRADAISSRSWLTKAATLGHPAAQRALVEMQ